MVNKSVKHLVSSADVTKEDCEGLIRKFNYFLEKGISPDLARGKVLTSLFLQPSTRTMTMFQSGIIRMGGGWLGVTDVNAISMGKGESLEDTIKEYSSFSDIITIRHPDDDSAERAAKSSFVPVINCGSGSREHAVGAPMMLMITQYYLNRPLKGIKIGLYGTPEINRVSKAMVPLMGFYGVDLVIDDLGHFPLPKEVEEKAKKNGIKSIRYDKLDNFIGDIDILMVTRGLQKGIIPPDKFPKEKEELILKSYKPITMKEVSKMKKDAVIFPIKPLIFEIDREVDKDPRARYTQPEPFTEMAAAVIAHYLEIKI